MIIETIRNEKGEYVAKPAPGELFRKEIKKQFFWFKVYFTVWILILCAAVFAITEIVWK